MDKPLHLMAATHYENFPVGSFLLPRELRRPIRLIYAFARVADDIADEGEASTDARLSQLDQWENGLKSAAAGGHAEPFFLELGQIINSFSLPISLFHDLIEAFRMDARGARYETFEELKFYCRHSANPIGRLLLHLLGSATEELFGYSDAICTGLQLTNFWQDLSVDIQRNRVYIPREDFSRFGISQDDLHRIAGTGAVLPLLKYQVERTRKFFLDGMPLLHRIDKRFVLELRLTVNGGMRILDKIAAQDYDTLRRRPSLSTIDRVLLFGRSLLAH